MALRIGLVGFGRIGRALFRLGHDRPGIEFVAICDDGDADSLVYLLNNSTVEGPFESPARREGNYLVSKNQKVRILKQSLPGGTPWDSLGVDIVFECTGKYRSRPELLEHIRAGASLVVTSTPPENDSFPIFVRGINDDEITGKEKIISCGSSSIHALALVCKVLSGVAPIELASMTTVHAYTGDQQLSDMATPGLRWSRSAAQNIIPNTTWAPEMVARVLPSLQGKIDGIALNVPVQAGSNIDLVTKHGGEVELETVNAAFRRAAEGEMKGLIGYTEEPIVSSDVIGKHVSALYDANATLAMEGGLLKTLTWFDNGWAYAARMLETAEMARGKGCVR